MLQSDQTYVVTRGLLNGDFLKRAFDVFLSFLGLVLSFPLWIIISLMIFLDDRGPIFFSLMLPGRHDKPFSSFKFRTMKHLKEGSHEMVFLEHDPRVTRVGKILRATALDELPQLINILKGDMSFVGPRPVDRSEGNPRYTDISQVPGYEMRRQIRPGLTGIAQLYADKYISPRKKFRYDNLYVKNMRFLLDIKLILFAFWVTFRGNWERKGRKI
jgi:lipopolysaccharide/colanic/teichoic acid biosynthesis glycosyltransferase